MSIELHVRIPGPADVPKIEARLTTLLGALFRPKPSIVLVEALDVTDSAFRNSWQIRLDEEVWVAVDCCTAGTVEALGAEGGWWAIFSPGRRTAEAFLLTTLSAVVAAQHFGEDVLDEAGLFGGSRFLRVADILGVVEHARDKTFAEASESLARELKLWESSEPVNRSTDP